MSPLGLDFFEGMAAIFFATVQRALKRYGYAQTCAPETEPAAPKEAPGAIVTIDVAKAASDPDHAIVSNVPAPLPSRARRTLARRLDALDHRKEIQHRPRVLYRKAPRRFCRRTDCRCKGW